MAYKPKYYMDISSKHLWIRSRVLVYRYGRHGFILHLHSRRSLILYYHNILGFSLTMRYSKTIGPILSKFTAFTTDI